MYDVVDLELPSNTQMSEVDDLELALDQFSSSVMVLHCDAGVQLENLWTTDGEHVTHTNHKILSSCCTKRCTVNFSVLERVFVIKLFKEYLECHH